MKKLLANFWPVLVMLFLYTNTVSAYFLNDNDEHPFNKSHATELDSLFWEQYYNNYKEAHLYAREGLKISRKIKYKKGEANHLNNIGLIYLRRNIYDSAFFYIHKSYEINKKYDYKNDLASSLNNLGAIYNYRGLYKKALEVYLESLKILNELDADLAHVASVENNIGAILLTQKNYSKAQEYLQNALEKYKQVRDTFKIASTLSNLGNIYSEKKQYKKAIDYYFKAVSRYKDIGYLEGFSDIYLNIAGTYIETENYDKAITYCTKSIEISRESGDYLILGLDYVTLGEAYLKSGKYEKALKYLNDGLNVGKEIESYDIKKGAYKMLSKAYGKTSNYEKAFGAHKRFKKYSDSLLDQKQRDRILEMEMKYRFDKKLKVRELENRRKEKLREVQIKRQRIFTYLGFSFALVAFVLVYIIHRALRSKQYVNKQLAKQKAEILEKNASLSQQQEEILAQRDELDQQKEIATEQRDEIVSKNTEITASIQYAKSIQSALLPQQDYMNKILPDYFIFFKPKAIVSGDFYWVHQKGEKLFIAVGDCTGHGVPGAFMSLLSITLINDIINSVEKYDAAYFLNLLREKVIKSLHQKNTYCHNRDGMDLSFCIIDREKMNLQFAGAYNPVYLLREGTLYEYKADRMTIGIDSKNDKTFQKHTVNIQKDDVLYLFTDGFTDQLDEIRHKKFQKDRFKELLKKISNLALDEQKRRIENEFLNWKGDYEQIDDVLVMGIKF